MGLEDQYSNIFISRNPKVIFFMMIFFTCLRTQVTKTKLIEDDTSLETFLGWPEKWVFRRFYENWSNSIMVSSKTRGQIIKRELILDSPNLHLRNKIKIFILDMHRTSYGHLKQWYKMGKFCQTIFAKISNFLWKISSNVKFSAFFYVTGPN